MREKSFAWAAEEDSSAIDAALAVMNADELREVIRFILPWLDQRARGRLVNDLIDRAARGSSGWTPDGPSARTIASIASFAEVATGDGYADAAEVDDYLRLGSNAFLGKDYHAAREIFRTLGSHAPR